MIPFRTTRSQLREIPRIVTRMKRARIDPALIQAASDIAQTDQGVFDLMDLWASTRNKKDRDAAIDDLRRSVGDYDAAPASIPRSSS